MARYLQTAKRYQQLPTELLQLVPEEDRPRAAELIARLVNAGMVGAPRGVQSTVRLNYVSEVCKDLPIRCSLETKEVNPDDLSDHRTYNALVVTAK